MISKRVTLFILALVLLAVFALPGCGGGGGGSSASGGYIGGGGTTTATPTITSITPANPPVGSECTISGSGFGASKGARDSDKSTVRFVSTADGGTSTDATIYNSWSDSQIKCIVPALTVGQNYVTMVNVVSAAGTVSSSSTQSTANTITPQQQQQTGVTITTVTPNSVQQGAGTTVTITGSGFGTTKGSVTFGSVSQTTTLTWADTQITCAVPTALASGTVGVKVVTAAGTSSNSASLNIYTAATGTLTGRVYDIFSGTSMSAATVNVNSVSTESNTSGVYSMTPGGTGESRMTVSSGSIVTRSFPVNVTNASQDVSVVASTYNTDMLRAYCWGQGQSSMRWNTKPTAIVIYNTLSRGTSAVSQADITTTQSWLQNEFFTLANSYFSGTTVEVYNGRPEDDPRNTVSDAGIIGQNTIAIYWSDTITGTTQGEGGWSGQGNVIVGGFAHIRNAGRTMDLQEALRHEMGHATGFTHPFASLGVTNPKLEYSVMNYYYAKSSSTYTTSDLNAYIYYYHRAPGNVAPDRDPDGYAGYKHLPVKTVIFRD
ncbi:MAG: IPT/TIG domain-containing protein [Candidatus Eremiobacteraeota bacterium]|nr:IPT/TIG domain-containing protein [Candidatus Eremiobacteraeota bacterium]